MDWQWIANGAFTIAGVLLAMLMNSMKQSVENLERQDSELIEKMQAIQLIVVENYVKRDDLDKLTSALFAKLDKIENKLDKKVDK
jgi:hypothetical protein